MKSFFDITAKYKAVFCQPSPKHKGMRAAAILCLGEPAERQRGRSTCETHRVLVLRYHSHTLTEHLKWVAQGTISPSRREKCYQEIKPNGARAALAGVGVREGLFKGDI